MEMVTEYEVEGCWAKPRSGHTCRACGQIQEAVPEEGHFNSKYWALQQPDGQFLLCCPDGCSNEDADAVMAEYLKLVQYTVDGSKSYDFRLDYTKTINYWIEPSGKVHPLSKQEHVDFACEKDMSESDLDDAGWVKITGSNTPGGIMLVMSAKPLTSYQVKAVVDIGQAHSGKCDEFLQCVNERGGVCADIAR